MFRRQRPNRRSILRRLFVALAMSAVLPLGITAGMPVAANEGDGAYGGGDYSVGETTTIPTPPVPTTIAPVPPVVTTIDTTTTTSTPAPASSTTTVPAFETGSSDSDSGVAGVAGDTDTAKPELQANAKRPSGRTTTVGQITDKVGDVLVATPAAIAAVASTTASAARVFRFPLTLGGGALAYLFMQARLDRQDPKLRAAPLTREVEMLEFRSR